MIYRVPGTTDQGIGVFARVSGSPSERNLISFYADGGITFKGLIPSRSRRHLRHQRGVCGHLGSGAQARPRRPPFCRRGAVDPETGEFTDTGGALPVRSSEALIEVTYQAQIIPGWTVQPDVQYVFRPGGNIPNPRDPNGAAIKNAAIFGLRTTIRY